uniref:EVE domain-containing protein n=1 Tax=Mimiviridae sp. ChoanoV1 TaxID=2596887 RepID=A0A5B8HW61_9VIRU|nr:hypothetical protein 6_21 [Mimiviridae sp. ChoanoV1]
MPEHWIIRIGNGNHFINSSKFNIWGINSKDKCNTNKFINEVKNNDILWFVTSKSSGKAIAIAKFEELKDREIGPLISFSQINEELGWTEHDGDWDIEIHFTELFNIDVLDILTKINSPRTYRRYSDNVDKIPVKLIDEYENIKKYTKVTKEM